MSEEKVLTKEIAEQFNADEDSVDLSKYTSLDEEAAIALSKSDAWHINLDGVTDLSESVISVFVDHSFLPSLKGWSGMNDKLAELVLSSDCWTLQGCLSLDSKKLLIPYLPERFIMYTSKELDFSIEGYEVIDRESYAKLLEMLEVEGSVYVGNLPDHYDVDLEYSELVDSFFVYRTSEEAVLAFEETLGFYTIGSSFTERILGDDEGSVLTKEIIENVLAESGDVAELSHYYSIEDDAVDALIGFEERLNLGGFVELSDAMHDTIPHLKCSVLGLSGLTSLNDEDASSLSKFKGEAIGLQGLSEISDSAAKALSHFKGELDLSLIYKLSDESASHFAKHKGVLFLTGIEELSDEAANCLKEKFTPNQVVLSDELNAKLNSLRSITLDVVRMLIEDEEFANNYDQFEFTQIEDDAAELLSNFEDDELFLDGVAELSDAAAESLSKYNGDLSLTGLKSLGDNAATSFSKFKGGYLDLNRQPDWEPAPCQPSHRLTMLSEAAAKSLAKIDPDKLSLTDELQEQVAKYR